MIFAAPARIRPRRTSASLAHSASRERSPRDPRSTCRGADREDLIAWGLGACAGGEQGGASEHGATRRAGPTNQRRAGRPRDREHWRDRNSKPGQNDDSMGPGARVISAPICSPFPQPSGIRSSAQRAVTSPRVREDLGRKPLDRPPQYMRKRPMKLGSGARARVRRDERSRNSEAGGDQPHQTDEAWSAAPRRKVNRVS